MSDFPNKQFNGTTYTFGHLAPTSVHVPLVVAGQELTIPVHVTFGCHCFTEEFNEAMHQEHHRYTHRHETRAFDVTRYQCSLQLPEVLQGITRGRIYLADQSYTYVAQISLPPATGMESYSLFFSLNRKRNADAPAAEMYLKSAYLSPLKSKKNAQSWRFAALVGEVSGAFPPPKAPTARNAKRPN